LVGVGGNECGAIDGITGHECKRLTIRAPGRNTFASKFACDFSSARKPPLDYVRGKRRYGIGRAYKRLTGPNAGGTFRSLPGSSNSKAHKEQGRE
jgi:hypothetical protein